MVPPCPSLPQNWPIWGGNQLTKFQTNTQVTKCPQKETKHQHRCPCCPTQHCQPRTHLPGWAKKTTAKLLSLEVVPPAQGQEEQGRKQFLVEKLWLRRLPTAMDTGNSSVAWLLSTSPQNSQEHPQLKPAMFCVHMRNLLHCPQATLHFFSWWLILPHFYVLPDKAVLLARSNPHLMLINATY